MEAVFGKLLEHYLKPNGRNGGACAERPGRSRAERAPNPESRYVPQSLKREIYSRDNATCTYVAPNGTRCCQKSYLHIDHIVPFALGGTTELSNLRLLCSAHNKLEAEKVFGKWTTIENLSTVRSTGGSAMTP